VWVTLQLLQKSTLRQLLTIPYVLLVLLAALVIGVLSFQAGRAIGYALFPDDGKDFHTLIERADVQLYAAKTGLRKRRSSIDIPDL